MGRMQPDQKQKKGEKAKEGAILHEVLGKKWKSKLCQNDCFWPVWLSYLHSKR